MTKKELIRLLKNCCDETNKKECFEEAEENCGAPNDTEAQKWENAFDYLEDCIKIILELVEKSEGAIQ